MGGIEAFLKADAEKDLLRFSTAGGIDDGTDLAALPRARPAAQVVPESTLREAMEIIMTSSTSVAVIDDDGRFGGVVTLERIRAALAVGVPERVA